jgi:hypothetical protein
MAKLSKQTLDDLTNALLTRSTTVTKDVIGLIGDNEQKAEALFSLLLVVLGQNASQLSMNCAAETGHKLSVEFACAVLMKKIMSVMEIENKMFDQLDELLARTAS